MEEAGKKLTMKAKKEVAEKIKENPRWGYKRISREFNITVSQARTIKTNLHYVLGNKESSGNNIRVRTDAKYGEFYGFLLEKVKNLRNNGFPISKNDIKTVANIIKNGNVKFENIMITDYFIRTFIEHHQLHSVKIHQTLPKSNDSEVQKFMEEFESVKQIYCKDDIYNTDETSLFIKSPNNRSYVQKNDRLNMKGISQIKTRMTILLTVNVNGDFLNTLIVGTSKRPRALKNKSLESINICYTANKSAWITKENFFSYFQNINEQMKQSRRKICIILDNFSGHKISDFTHVRFLFLPANSTNLLQPLDMGIIKSFKDKYYNFLKTDLLNRQGILDMNYSALIRKINIYEVIIWVSQSIRQISPDTVYNCWVKAKLVDGDEIMESINDDLQNGEEESVSNEIEEVQGEEQEEVQGDQIIELEEIKTEHKDAIMKLNELEAILLEHDHDSYAELINLKQRVISRFLSKQKKNTLYRFFIPK